MFEHKLSKICLETSLRFPVDFFLGEAKNPNAGNSKNSDFHWETHIKRKDISELYMNSRWSKWTLGLLLSPECSSSVALRAGTRLSGSPSAYLVHSTVPVTRDVLNKESPHSLPKSYSLVIIFMGAVSNAHHMRSSLWDDVSVVCLTCTHHRNERYLHLPWNVAKNSGKKN